MSEDKKSAAKVVWGFIGCFFFFASFLVWIFVGCFGFAGTHEGLLGGSMIYGLDAELNIALWLCVIPVIPVCFLYELIFGIAYTLCNLECLSYHKYQKRTSRKRLRYLTNSWRIEQQGARGARPPRIKSSAFKAACSGGFEKLKKRVQRTRFSVQLVDFTPFPDRPRARPYRSSSSQTWRRSQTERACSAREHRRRWCRCCGWP